MSLTLTPSGRLSHTQVTRTNYTVLPSLGASSFPNAAVSEGWGQQLTDDMSQLGGGRGYISCIQPKWQTRSQGQLSHAHTLGMAHSYPCH